ASIRAPGDARRYGGTARNAHGLDGPHDLRDYRGIRGTELHWAVGGLHLSAVRVLHHAAVPSDLSGAGLRVWRVPVLRLLALLRLLVVLVRPSAVRPLRRPAA